MDCRVVQLRQVNTCFTQSNDMSKLTVGLMAGIAIANDIVSSIWRQSILTLNLGIAAALRARARPYINVVFAVFPFGRQS